MEMLKIHETLWMFGLFGVVLWQINVNYKLFVYKPYM